MHSISRRRFMAASAALGSTSFPVLAQEYPTRTISIVIGTAAGSGADAIARYFADKLRPALGQPVVIDNKPGAYGSIAASQVARAKPDGYSLLFAPNISFAATQYFIKNPPFNPVKDFIPVGTLAWTPFFLVVSAQKSTATTVSELTGQLRAKGDNASYGSPTAISLAAAEAYKSAAGLRTRQVPYKTMQQALVDLANGDIDFLYVDAPTMMAQLGGNRYRALAVSTDKRSSAAPNIPTMAEAGVANCQPISVWFALAGPAGTPAVIADKLNSTLNRILATEETARFLRATGYEQLGGSRHDMESIQAREIQTWQHIAKVARIEPQ